MTDSGPASELQAGEGVPDAPAEVERIPLWRRLAIMDWIAIALFVLGWTAVATGLLPAHDARATVTRILPLLVFLGSVIVLARLDSEAQLFDVLAFRLTALGRGRTWVLFPLCVLFAAATTIFLNLDTTAVLLTPVLLATARRARMTALPLAMTTVWLANTASLLLPVSNLTNLLAADRVELKTLPFARQMALPQLAVLGVVSVALWLFYWRSEPARYEVPPQLRPRNRWTFALAGVCTAMFIGGILAGVSIAVAAVVTAALLTLGFVRWDRSSLTWNLISWRLLVFVTGLFLVVDTIGRHGLSSLVSSLIGTDPGGAGIVRAALTGAGLSNAVNNLPAYVAGEAVIPVANHHQLIGLLIGTNVGPVIVPWASLATLIWAEHCRHAGVTINWRRFMVTGALMAAGALTAAVAVLIAMPLHDHGGSISLPFLDTSGSVQAARLKQQGRRFPLSIFDILTSTRRLRVSGFLVAFTQRTHSQRAIGVMSFHRSWIFCGAATRAVSKSCGTSGSGQSPVGSISSVAVSPALMPAVCCSFSSTLIQWPEQPSGSSTAWNSWPSIVPCTATCPRDGSFSLAFSGNRRIVDLSIVCSVASKRIAETPVRRVIDLL